MIDWKKIRLRQLRGHIGRVRSGRHVQLNTGKNAKNNNVVRAMFKGSAEDNENNSKRGRQNMTEMQIWLWCMIFRLGQIIRRIAEFIAEITDIVLKHRRN